jgi:hypothetical protein
MLLDTLYLVEKVSPADLTPSAAGFCKFIMSEYDGCDVTLANERLEL